MKLTTLDEDLRIHQKLEDEPNDVGGLSAQALKEKFDQAGVTIQKYLNETHLPEEEKAVKDALFAAKAYTDAKAITLEQGNMKTAVYDAKKRRRDIFDYTDEKIAELQANKTSGTWVCSGACYCYSTGTPVTLNQFTELADPNGLWSETEKAIVVPEGGKAALLLAHVRSSKTYGCNTYLRILINGEQRASRILGFYKDNTVCVETMIVPLTVEDGDKIAVQAEGYIPSGSSGSANALITSLGIIIFS